MKAKAVFWLILLIIFFSGCLAATYPVYERSDTENNGITVNIDGVLYQMYPRLKWKIHAGEGIIGYAGSRNTTISTAKDDTEMNFIYLHDSGKDMYYRPLYRTDKIPPEPSADTVTKLYWSEYAFNGNKKNHIGNYITDSEVIRELFESLNSGDKTQNYEILNDYSIDITCYSDQVPGAYYELSLKNSNGKIVCGNHEEGFTEIPIALLERIAGYEIDIAELLS